MLLENYSTCGGAAVSCVISDTALLLIKVDAWNRIILERIIDTELVNKFPIYM